MKLKGLIFFYLTVFNFKEYFFDFWTVLQLQPAFMSEWLWSNPQFP
jgi:hypothetical protein